MATISQALEIALTHHRAGRLDLAEEICRRIVALEPSHADALHMLGVIAHQAGQHAVAMDLIVRAIAAQPSAPAYHNSLGEAYRALGRVEEAIAAYGRALALKPGYAEAHNNLGNAWKQQGQPDAARACYEQAIASNPEFAVPHYNLGGAWLAEGNLVAAVASYQRAIDLQPNYADAHNNLGVVFDAQGKPDAAVACYRRAIELEPRSAELYRNLSRAFCNLGELDEAVACCRQALELDPGLAQARSDLLLMLQYRPAVTLEELAAAHAEFERRHAAPLAVRWSPHGNDRTPGRRLRLGFLSPDLRQHPAGYLVVRTLEHVDPAECEVICYSNHLVADAVTRRIRAAASVWRDCACLTDDQLARQIRADRVDILVDLAGHTADNRLLVFARKPAPIQITWIGYAGTTGLRAMDYLLADRYQVAAEAETYYVERVLRMPDGYVCFDPPSEAPAVGPLPALGSGRVTLGSFNNPAKITPGAIATWARILRRVPQSRLLLKFRSLDGAEVSARLRRRFTEEGIEPQRLELAAGGPRAALLGAYNQVDLALDTFPYSGGLTSCEALWMGVPVVTCPGETFASRHTLSHLSTVGLTETIARNLDEYVELAVQLANDLPRLEALRATLRDRVAASPLCDGKRFAGNLMRLLRSAWREWCGGPEST